jgi:molybdenum cofactor synthesis domain-containing protein
MKKIATADAVGHVICHDITRIIKDVVKDTAFHKGHIITEEDIPLLLSLGKDNIYVWEKNQNMLHENQAAEILRDICKNKNINYTEVREGKIELTAEIDGLFRVDTDRLNSINELDDITIASRHTNYPVKKGDKLAGTRIIPLVIEKSRMEEVKEIAGSRPLMELLPYKNMKAGIVTTGNEVFFGRIKDTFTPVIEEKLNAYGIEVCGHIIRNDDLEKITSAILELKNNGADIIICTGGMSVDPDDLTPGAIRNSGANIVSYGAPVLPGSMFLLAYYNDGTPVLGLPGCVMYAETTIFDIVLPRICAGIKITKKDIARMGNGGFCLGCSSCNYPNCGFGKGA